MMKSIIATNPTELVGIIDYVHDRTYELDRVHFDEPRKVLTLPIKLNRKRLEGLLYIKKVQAYQVIDRAMIGEGDINTITYDGGFVLIKGSLPVELRISVTELEIELLIPFDAPVA